MGPVALNYPHYTGYLEKNTSGVLQPDELLRAEWVARLSALDLYVHELVAQQMLEIFQGRRHVTPAFLRFQYQMTRLTGFARRHLRPMRELRLTLRFANS